MPSLEDTQHQTALLATYRRTLAILIQQQAIFGSAYAPPSVIIGINEARVAIRRIKQTLHSWGYEVEDQPNDEDQLSLPTAPIDTGLNTSIRKDQVVIGNQQHIGGNARVGVAVSGDIYGNISISNHNIDAKASSEINLNKLERCISIIENYISFNRQQANEDFIEDLEDISRNLQIAKKAAFERKQDRFITKVRQAYDTAVRISNNASKDENIDILTNFLEDILEGK